MAANLETADCFGESLGVQNLAFRGFHMKLNTSGNGNFLKFVEFLPLFDQLMEEHLRKITDNETHVHYLGKDIQNELVQLYQMQSNKQFQHLLMLLSTFQSF